LLTRPVVHCPPDCLAIRQDEKQELPQTAVPSLFRNANPTIPEEPAMKTARSHIAIHTAVAVAVAIGLATVLVPMACPEIKKQISTFCELAFLGLPNTVLLVGLLFCHSHAVPRYRWGIVGALVFSQAGGYMMGVHNGFVSGVLLYLVANLFYITAFSVGVRFGKRIFPFVIYGSYAACILCLTWNYIAHGMHLPFVLYCLTIVSVPSQALTRYLAFRKRSMLYAALGAPCLLISDSIIILNAYYTRWEWWSFLIQITYFVGQWFIVLSVLNAEPETSHTTETA
jgi:uncharacterized membrane protein YhhN